MSHIHQDLKGDPESLSLVGPWPEEIVIVCKPGKSPGLRTQPLNNSLKASLSVAWSRA